jgi:hypothetical protein
MSPVKKSASPPSVHERVAVSSVTPQVQSSPSTVFDSPSTEPPGAALPSASKPKSGISRAEAPSCSVPRSPTSVKPVKRAVRASSSRSLRSPSKG